MTFSRGDLVHLSRAQTSQVLVVAVPGAPDTPYQVTLPVDPGRDVTFTLLGQPGQSLSDVAAALEEALLRDQTPFSVALTPLGTGLVVVGPVGRSFDVGVSANLSTTVLELAVLAVTRDLLGHERPVGLMRVLEAESTAEKLRQYTTRTPDGVLLQVEEVRLRELDRSEVFDVTTDKVLTVVQRVGVPDEEPHP